MNFLNFHHVADLQREGYLVIQDNTSGTGDRPGVILVADPVLCMSGNKRWAEVRKVYLRSPAEVVKFIEERS